MCESITTANIPPGKPRVFEKISQIPDPAGNFCWQMPRVRSNYDSQIRGPPVHPTNIQKYWLPFFNKHNCFRSTELYKTDHEMSTSHSD